jgi:outer membrane protein OmpA-like peptidoglycan-associated protein
MSDRKSLVRVQREARRSHGQELDPSVRKQMEARVGRSLEGVKVHTDARAASLADSLGASAFTVGNDVFFGAGMYAPGTSRGDRTLVHELTHVAQREGQVPERMPHAVAHESSTAEREAHRIARGVGGVVRERAPTGVIHRQPAGEAKQDGDGKKADMPDEQAHPRVLHDFGFNQSWPPQNTSDLKLLANDIKNALKDNSSLVVTLTGHTDEIGDDDYNFNLGVKRAEAVKNWLVKHEQVPETALAPASAGKTQPVAGTHGKTGTNRRVVAEFSMALPRQAPVPPPQPAPKKKSEYDEPPPPQPVPRGPILPQDPGPPLFPAGTKEETEKLRKKWEANQQAKENERRRKQAEDLDRLLKQALEAQKKGAPLDQLEKKVTDAVKKIGLPDWLAEKAIEGVKKGIEKGVDAAIGKAIDATPYDDATKDMLRNIFQSLPRLNPQ